MIKFTYIDTETEEELKYLKLINETINYFINEYGMEKIFYVGKSQAVIYNKRDLKTIVDFDDKGNRSDLKLINKNSLYFEWISKSDDFGYCIVNLISEDYELSFKKIIRDFCFDEFLEIFIAAYMKQLEVNKMEDDLPKKDIKESKKLKI